VEWGREKGKEEKHKKISVFRREKIIIIFFFFGTPFLFIFIFSFVGLLFHSCECVSVAFCLRQRM
jgi:hypothetical protein